VVIVIRYKVVITWYTIPLGFQYIDFAIEALLSKNGMVNMDKLLGFL